MFFFKYFFLKSKYYNNFFFEYNLDTLLKNFLNKKIYRVVISSVKKITFENKKKKYISTLSLAINKDKNRPKYFLKFLKYLFLSKNFFFKIKCFMFFELNGIDIIKKVHAKTILKKIS